jgi:hypothetical protein
MSPPERNWVSQGRFAGLCAVIVLAIACLDSYELSLGTPPDAGRNCDAGDCGECNDDRDCDRPSQPRCDRETRRCVRCLSDTDCDDDRVCNSAWRRCVEACDEREDCRDRDRPFCQREHSACVECLDDGDCRDDDCVRGVCD